MLRLKTFGGLAILRDGAPAEGAGAQRRRLALLALLAAAGERGMSREKIVGVLWPESDLERARKNLAQAVYALRRDLGAEELVVGTTDLRLSPDLLTSDLAEFQRAMAEGRFEDAVELYGGPFLDGIYLEEAPEFERWAEEQRAHHAREFITALQQVAANAATRGDHRSAVTFCRRLANADPLNAKAALGLMRALDSGGDRPAALQHFRVYETLLRQELDLAPDAEVRRFAEQLRRQQGEPPAPGAVAPEAPPTRVPLTDVTVRTLPGTPAVTRVSQPETPPARRVVSGFTDEYARPRPIQERPVAPAMPLPARRLPFLKRRSTRMGIALGFFVGLAVTVLVTSRLGRRASTVHPAMPVVAVGMIQDYTHRGERLGRLLADMLATDLARATTIQVISTARMYELMAHSRQGADTAAEIMRAARAAGATQLLGGTLSEMAGGRLRLDLQRVDLATGNVLSSYSAEAEDLFELVAETRNAMVPGIDAGRRGSLAEVTTGSVVAYRLYEEGLRALFSGDAASARRLFSAALAEDSAFAMAAYWLARTGGAFNDRTLIRGLEQAVRLAANASDRERLTIMAGWADATDATNRLAYAETLSVRYPNEPDGYLWLGHARKWTGDFAGSIAPLRAVIAMDSLGLKADPATAATPAPCRACEGYIELIGAYHMMDSVPAAIRTAREWAREQPRNINAWGMVSWGLMLLGHFNEAVAADQAVIAIAPAANRDIFRYNVALRAGDFASADAYFEQLTRTDPGEGLKWLSISRRMQGRPRDALQPAQRLRSYEKVARRDAAPYNALFEAQTWFDLGEFRRAAALFDSISLAPRDSTPSQVARHKAWTETLRATALAAAGDTASLPGIIDSVEAWGRRTGYGRDQRLHHHIRGLLQIARGRLEQAIPELREAIFSPTLGYTRTNLEMGRALLRLGRPREAATWAESGLRGGLDAANSYATYTELAELAALGWDAAGVRDSAVARYLMVINNWKSAEPAFSRRVEHARLRVALLTAAN